jgi:transcriptional antiterminator Rof (Rho-off)
MHSLLKEYMVSQTDLNAKVKVECLMRREEIETLLSESDRLSTLHHYSNGRMSCEAKRARKKV